MADSSEPAFLFLYRKGAVAPVDYLSTFATAPLQSIDCTKYNRYGFTAKGQDCANVGARLCQSTGNREKNSFDAVLRKVFQHVFSVSIDHNRKRCYYKSIK